MTQTAVRETEGTATKRWRFPRHVVVFLAPAVVIYTMFMVYPLLDSLRLSLFSDEGAYVGLENLRQLIPGGRMSGEFLNALGNNFIFFGFHFLVQNPIGLLIAALLTQPALRGRGVYRTLIFGPTLLSVVIVGFIWQLIISPLWGLIDTPLLGLTATALPTISLMSVWQFVGIPMMFFYAVLVGIPEDYLEAARVDGANSWKVFWRITFPLLLPMLGIISVITYIANLNAFDLIYSVQGALAGPEFSSDIMGTLFYRTFFGFQLQIGSTAMGAAVATAMFVVILIGVMVYLFGFQRRVTTYEL
ncbi:MAG: carbohydrate ABC transporter permease [Acidimicrobiia bacterium]